MTRSFKLIQKAHNAFVEIVEMRSGVLRKSNILVYGNSPDRYPPCFQVCEIGKHMVKRRRNLSFVLLDQLEGPIALLIEKWFDFLQLLPLANVFQAPDDRHYEKSLSAAVNKLDGIRVFPAVKHLGQLNQVSSAFLDFFKLRVGRAPYSQQIPAQVQAHEFLMAIFLTIIRFAHRLNRQICGKDSKSAPDDGLKVVHPLRPPINRAVTENNRGEYRHRDRHRKKSEHPVIHPCPVVSPRYHYRQFDRNFQVGLNKRISNNV